MPTTSITPASITHAARQSQVEITNCTRGAMTITPLELPSMTTPVARPRYLANHLPAVTAALTCINPWSAMRIAVNAT